MSKTEVIEAAIPAEDPTPDEATSNDVVQVTYAELFNQFYGNVINAIGNGTNNLIDKQQYRLKAADIAQWLVSVSLAQSRQTPA